MKGSKSNKSAEKGKDQGRGGTVQRDQVLALGAQVDGVGDGPALGSGIGRGPVDANHVGGTLECDGVRTRWSWFLQKEWSAKGSKTVDEVKSRQESNLEILVFSKLHIKTIF